MRKVAVETVESEFNVKERKRRIRDSYRQFLERAGARAGKALIPKGKEFRKVTTEELRHRVYKAYELYPPRGKTQQDFEIFVGKDIFRNAEIVLQKSLPKPRANKAAGKNGKPYVSLDEYMVRINREIDKMTRSKGSRFVMRKALNEALAKAKGKGRYTDSTTIGLRIKLRENPNFSFDDLNGRMSKELSDKIYDAYNEWIGVDDSERKEIEARVYAPIEGNDTDPGAVIKPLASNSKTALYTALLETLASLREVQDNYEETGKGGVIWDMDNKAGKGGMVYKVIENRVREFIDKIDDRVVEHIISQLGTSNLGNFEAYNSDLVVKNKYDSTGKELRKIDEIVSYFENFLRFLSIRGLKDDLKEIAGKGNPFNEFSDVTNLSKGDMEIWTKAKERYERRDAEKAAKIGWFEEGDE